MSTFSEDFLKRYPAFRGDLTPGDQSIGEQWFRIWQAAQDAARLEAANRVRASAHLFATPDACESLAREVRGYL